MLPSLPSLADCKRKSSTLDFLLQQRKASCTRNAPGIVPMTGTSGSEYPVNPENLKNQAFGKS